MLPRLVGEAWPHAFTPLNILSGFKKCGIHPLNPGEICDRQCAPSKAVTPSPNEPSDCSPFTPEKAAQFRKYYEEGYDVENPEYRAWLRINHPDDCNSAPSECSSGPLGISSSSHSSDISDVLVLPQAQSSKPSKRKSENCMHNCVK